MAIYGTINGFMAIIGTSTGILPGIVLLTWALQLGHTTLLPCLEIGGANTRLATGSIGAGLLVGGVRGHIEKSYMSAASITSAREKRLSTTLNVRGQLLVHLARQIFERPQS